MIVKFFSMFRYHSHLGPTDGGHGHWKINAVNVDDDMQKSLSQSDYLALLIDWIHHTYGYIDEEQQENTSDEDEEEHREEWDWA